MCNNDIVEKEQDSKHVIFSESTCKRGILKKSVKVTRDCREEKGKTPAKS